MEQIQSGHFLYLPRPDSTTNNPLAGFDTSTVAAHDFDVDTRTGFMPAQQPVRRLPAAWESWEDVLDSAISARLQLGCKKGLKDVDRLASEQWRARVRELPILPTADLMASEVLLRRAHLTLAWIMHFYIHTLPPSSPIQIPPPITVPLLQVSAQLQLPPILTYSDDVLYNWKFKDCDRHGIPTVDNIDSHTLFTQTRDEAEFYLTSARMELKGVEALDLMKQMMDEAFVGDDIAIRRITEYLDELAGVIRGLGEMLMGVKQGCSPQVFYEEIRPWFKGEDSSEGGVKWEFQGLELDDSLVAPTELSGASAGQSALIHALDVFLGVDQFSHSRQSEESSASLPQHRPRSAFLKRMQLYMPRHHRAFLDHLAASPRPIRNIVEAQAETGSSGSLKLLDAYNRAVQALKEFRDKHMIIVALYIIGPARRGPPAAVRQPNAGALKGTGGTDLVKFLKGVRDQTKGALLDAEKI